MVKPVYIYADEGASQVGIESLQAAVKAKLHRQSVLVTAEQLIQQGLKGTDLLIMPGGADLPYCKKLNGVGNQHIRQFVAEGGSYLGICAGAYYACQQVDFIGQEYTVKGERELGFFPGVAKGSWAEFANDRLYDETVYSKKMIELDSQIFSHSVYYHGGPAFIPFDVEKNEAQILAYYPNRYPAIVFGRFGQGRYLLSGVHFEIQQAVYYARIVAKCNDPLVQMEEEQICHHFNAQYGTRLWQYIQTTLLQG